MSNSRKKITILLMRFPDNGARAFSFFKRSFYTHASIGLEEDMNTFYSFVWKGFLVEKVTKYVKPDREPYPCSLYEVEVSDEVYATVKEILLNFESNKQIYRYAKLGVIMGIIKIPVRQKNRFFCSQFVAEVLKQSKAASLAKNSALYFPGDFSKMSGAVLTFQGNLQSFISHYSLTPKTANQN